jgi:dTMP kinase
MDLNSLPPQFIVFEGTDGAGKSTQLAQVSKWLTEQGIDHITTREPGGTPMAEDIRSVVLNEREEPVSGKTELLLMFAAREQHLQNRIRPALADGRWVLCDRFIDTTYAYQIAGRGLNQAFFFDLMVNVVEDTAPNLTLFFDVSDEVGLERRNLRVDGKDRLDGEALEYHRVVNQTLQALAELPSHAIIDGEQDIDAVTAATITTIENHAEEVLEAQTEAGEMTDTE